MLALAQTQIITQRISQRWPKLTVAVYPVTTTGDRSALDGETPPENKDDFVREIENQLLYEEADLAVHSLKDLPSKSSCDLSVSTVCERVDPRDVLIGAKSFLDLPSTARIGTASVRRKALLNYFLLCKDSCVPIRGNIDTRLRKLKSGQYDALILAAAGLTRLNLEQEIGQYLDPTTFVPAPGQGTLAVEYRTSDHFVREIAQPLVVDDVECATQCERTIVKLLEVDCNAPLGVYCVKERDEFRVHLIALNPEGTECIQLNQKGKVVAELAESIATQLLAMKVTQLFS